MIALWGRRGIIRGRRKKHKKPTQISHQQHSMYYKRKPRDRSTRMRVVGISTSTQLFCRIRHSHTSSRRKTRTAGLFMQLPYKARAVETVYPTIANGPLRIDSPDFLDGGNAERCACGKKALESVIILYSQSRTMFPVTVFAIAFDWNRINPLKRPRL